MKKIILFAGLMASVSYSDAQTKVLYYLDFSAGPDAMGPALAATGCIVTTVSDNATFQSEISVPANYDIAIYLSQDYGADGTSAAALVNFVSLGKKGIFYDYTGNNTIGSTMGVSYTGNFNQTDVTITDPAMASAIPSNPFTLTNSGWGTYSGGMTALGGSTVAANFSGGEAAIVKSMGGDLIVMGFCADVGGSVEMYTNILSELGGPLSIATSALSGPFCQGNTINVTYSFTGIFAAGNVFTAELSDATGSFASPTVIGSVASLSSVAISSVIPVSALGSAYRIRVTGGSPGITGSDNGSDLIISGLPTANVTSSDIICNGGTSTVEVMGTGGTGPYTGEGTFSHTAGTYTYTVTDANGCLSADSTITITEPAPITHSQDIDLCEESSVTVGTSTYTTAGVYTDILINGNGCDSTVTTTITMLPAVNVSTTTSGITITAVATPATYEWMNCTTNALIPGAVSQNFTATANGDYAVLVTEGGCTDTSACVTISQVGIETNGSQIGGLTVYPNPAQSYFTLNFPVAETGDVVVRITDIQGKVVMVMTENALQGQYVKNVNLEGLDAGMYYLQVSYNNSQYTGKLIVE